MSERIFTYKDQLDFAELSGDTNPLHLDALVARRQMFGQIVVHGAHSLLWALDEYISGVTWMASIEQLEAKFLRPIFLDQKVECFIVCADKDRVEIVQQQSGVQVSEFKVVWRTGEMRYSRDSDNSLPKKREPVKRTMAELMDMSGILPLCFNMKLGGRLFPAISNKISQAEISTILATTRLVGMECPGYYSLYSLLSLRSHTAKLPSHSLHFKAAGVDFRFGLSTINVQSPVLHGQVKAFIRPEPVDQTEFSEIAATAVYDEFAGQRALVVGGSRGLGLAASRILAAGGADVRLTYNCGEEEAKIAVRDMRANSASVDYLKLNVLDSHYEELAELVKNNWAPTHLYYFATPFIFSAVKGRFSSALFKKFCDIYVEGFANVLYVLPRKMLRGVFYPSTVAIDEIPSNMGEYAAAKVAGELICDFIEKTISNISVHHPRLPRLATDQTVSLTPVDNKDPVAILREEIRLLWNITKSEKCS